MTLEEAARETLRRLDAEPIDDPYRYINSIAWCVYPLKEALKEAEAHICYERPEDGFPTKSRIFKGP